MNICLKLFINLIVAFLLVILICYLESFLNNQTLIIKDLLFFVFSFDLQNKYSFLFIFFFPSIFLLNIGLGIDSEIISLILKPINNYQNKQLDNYINKFKS